MFILFSIDNKSWSASLYSHEGPASITQIWFFKNGSGITKKGKKNAVMDSINQRLVGLTLSINSR